VQDRVPEPVQVGLDRARSGGLGQLQERAVAVAHPDHDGPGGGALALAFADALAAEHVLEEARGRRRVGHGDGLV
jgi:hypothetical protein